MGRRIFAFVALCAGVRECESLASTSARETPHLRTHALVQVGVEGVHKQKAVVQAKRQDPDDGDAVGNSAADLSAVAQNAAGDLDAFIAALVTNTVTCLGMFVVASVLRQKFPIIYSNNVLKGTAPFEPSEGFFGWVTASYQVTIDQVVEHAGLDQGMLLEFINLAMKILLILGIPLVGIMGPLHCWQGGNRSGDDYLSKWGLANVVDGHPWLYKVHAVIVWVVVIVVQQCVYRSQKSFLERRKKWLMEMPDPRATTILVENIPEEHRTDDKLKAYFNNMFNGEVVKDASVIKNTHELTRLVDVRNTAATNLEKAKFQFEKTGERPTHMELPSVNPLEIRLEMPSINPLGAVPSSVDSIDHYQRQYDETNGAIKQMRKDIIKDAAAGEDAALFTNAGFVTFDTRRNSEIALKVQFTADEDDFVVDYPPDPADVLYSDWQQDPLKIQARKLIGYAAVAGVFWAYLPFVVGCAQVASAQNLAHIIPSFQAMADDPVASAAWNALVGSLALTLFISFVPTFFVYIFTAFFQLKASAWLQNRIQVWYFWFQVLYVLLVTAVGSSVGQTFAYLAANPTQICVVLATTLPLSTHFYLNYLPLQWVTHATNSMRVVMLSKYLSFRVLFEDAKAKEMAEPEDQDFYGIGSRSARKAFMLVLSLVFCSLSPLITTVGFANFFICRLVYGYLIPFAENKKPDLGGIFWVTQLKHILQCMGIYVILMAGVLICRAADYGPGCVSSAAGAYWFWTTYRFDNKFRWETLSFEDLIEAENSKGTHRESSRSSYVQPELCEDN